MATEQEKQAYQEAYKAALSNGGSYADAKAAARTAVGIQPAPAAPQATTTQPTSALELRIQEAQKKAYTDNFRNTQSHKWADYYYDRTAGISNNIINSNFGDVQKLISGYKDIANKWGAASGKQRNLERQNPYEAAMLGVYQNNITEYQRQMEELQKQLERYGIAVNGTAVDASRYNQIYFDSIKGNAVDASAEYIPANGLLKYNTTFDVDKYLSHVNAEEMQMYNYLAANDPEKAEVYGQYLDNIVQQRLGEARAEEIQDKYTAGGRALSRGIEAYKGGLSETYNAAVATLSGRDKKTSAAEYAAEQLRADLASRGDEWWRTAGFDAMQSIGGMTPGLIAGAINPNAGMAVFGATSGMMGYQDKLAEGWNTQDARAYGILAGASEAALGKVLGGIPALGGVEGGVLSKLTKNLDNVYAKIILNRVGEMGSEALEEGLQTLIEPAIVSSLKGTPYDSPELREVLYSAVLGAISSAGFGAPTAVAQTVDASSAYDGRYGVNAQALVDEAKQIKDGSKAVAIKAQAQLDKGKSISNATAEKLTTTVNRGRMVDAVEAQITERTENLSPQVARSLANAVVAKSRGEKLTTNQKKLIETNKDIAAELAKELNPKKPADWAKRVGMRGADARVYGDRNIVNVVEEFENEVLHSGDYAEARANMRLPSQNAVDFTTDFDFVADVMGNSNVYDNFEAAWKEAQEQGTILTEAQARAAYEAGKARLNSADMSSKLSHRGTGAVSFAAVKDGGVEYEAPNEDEAAAFKRSARYEYLSALAKQVKVDIVFFKGGAEGINGKYIDGKVYLAIDASPSVNASVNGYVMLTAAHELTHYIREASPARYAELKDFVVKHIIDKGKVEGKNFKQLIMDKLSAYEKANVELTVDNAIEEIVADACEMMLKDNMLVAQLKEESPKLHNVLSKELKKFLKKVYKAFDGLKAHHTEAKVMMDKFKELQRIWNLGLTEAAQAEVTEQREDGEGKYSLKQYSQRQLDNWANSSRIEIYENDMQLRAFVGDCLSGAIQYKKMYFGMVPENMAQDIKRATGLDVEGFNCSLSSNEVNKIFKSHGKESGEKTRGQRAVTTDDIVKIPYVLENADEIERSSKLYNGKPAIIFKTAGDERTNIVAVVSDKHLDLFVQTMYINVAGTKKGNLATPTDEQASANTPEANNGTVSNNIISEKNNSVKDNEGNTLSTEQQEYFKDSKVRDAEGNLLVMYRGGEGEFTVFDRKKSKPSNLYGRGFYFTNSKNHAQQYGNARPFYLNITHPLGANHEISREQMYQFLKAIEEDGEDYDLYNYGEGATAESVLEQVWAENRTDFQMLNDINAAAIGDLVAATELFNEVNGTDYDGFILSTETVTFRSNQAKNVGNSTPTTSPDIRYSIKDEAMSDRMLLANTLMTVAQNDGERRRLNNYKAQMDKFEDIQQQLNEAELELSRVIRTGAKKDIADARRKRDGLMQQLIRADSKLVELQATKPLKDLMQRVKEDNAALKTENAMLRRKLEYWKGQTKRTRQKTINRSDIDKLVRNLVKTHGSDVDVEALKQSLYALGDYLVQDSELDYNKIYNQARKVAVELVENAVAIDDSEAYGDKAEIISDIKGVKYHLDEMYKNDLPEGFRKRYSGKLHISFTEGRGVDGIYENLQQDYGKALFPDVPTQADMLVVIGDVYDVLTAPPTTYNPYRSAINEVVASVTDDIIDAMLSEEVRQSSPTMADKVNAKLQRQKAAERRKLNELRAEKNARIAEIRQEEKQKRQAAVAKERAKADKRVAGVIDYYRDMKRRGIDSRSRTAIRKKIKDLHAQMSSRLLNPKENRYIPKPLLKTVAEILDEVNLDSGRSVKLKAKMMELSAEYKKIAQSNEYGFAFVPDVADMIDQLQQMLLNMDDTSIYNMTKAELEMVYNTMKALDHTVRTAVKLVGYESDKNIFELSRSMVNEIERATPINSKWLEKYIDATARADVFFKRLGGYHKDSTWALLGNMLNEAQRKQIQIQMEAAAIFEELMQDEDAFAAMTDYRNLIDIGLENADGEPVLVTKDIALKIYMDTMAEDNARHFMYSGYTVPNLKEYYKGKPSEAFNKGSVRVHGFGARLQDLRYKERHAETEQEAEDIRQQIEKLDAEAANWLETVRNSIYDQMGEYELEWVKAAEKFFNSYSQKVLNETTMAVYGFEKATVPYYVPIHTDSAYRQANFESITRDLNLENSGFMKTRLEGARNPMLAEGLVDVVNGQIGKVAKYAAMMPAVRNFQKVYGKSSSGFENSVQNAVRTKFGGDAVKYIENLLTDLTSPRRGEGALGELADKMRGNLAKAALSLNVGSAVEQVTSYPKAAVIVGYKPLIKALKDIKSNPRFDAEVREEIAKWTPLMWQRTRGHIDRDINSLREAQNLQGKAEKKLDFLYNWISEVEGVTVGQLWYAAQYYVEDSTDLKRGTDEFMRETAKVFNRIVEQTQASYNTMQRPDILRNPNALVKQMTMFMTERLQNANMIIDAVGTYNAYRKDFDKGVGDVTEQDVKEARDVLVRTSSSLIAGAAASVALKLFANALLYNMKGYRDEEDELTVASVSGQLVENFFESLASTFLWGAEVYDVMHSVVTGDTYYGISLSGVENFTDALNAMVKAAQEPTKESLWKASKTAMTMLGVPVNNANKLINALVYRIKDAAQGNGFWDFESEVKMTDERRAKLLYEAAVNGNEKKLEKLFESYGTEADADAALAKHIKWLFKTGELSAEEAIEQLEEFASMSEYDAELAIGKLGFELEQGFAYDEIQEKFVAGEITEANAVSFLEDYGNVEDAGKTVTQWRMEKETGLKYDKIKDYLAAEDITKQQAIEYRMKYGGQSLEDATVMVTKWMGEIETGIPYDKVEQYFRDGKITHEELANYYMKYWSYDEEKAIKVADKIEFIGEDSRLEDATLAAVSGYIAYCDEAEVDKFTYLTAYQTCYDIRADKDKNGKSISGSALKKKLVYIDGLNLAPYQKTAVAKAIGITDKQLDKYNAPWL